MPERETEPQTLGEAFAHLVEGGGVQPVTVDEHFWAETVCKLPPGRLVSAIENTSDWTSWEMHPYGDEFILLLTGRLTLIFERDQERWLEALTAGQFVVVPKGIWHTADVIEPGMALFITAGEGTEHRER